MIGALEWINRASAGWWSYIVDSSWQAALVGAALLAMVNLLGRRWPAPLRYAFLVLALLKFACPPLLPIQTGLFTHVTPPRVILRIMQERKPAQASASQPSATPSTSAAGLWQKAPRLFRSVHWTAWLMLLHGLGTGLMLWMLARQAAALRSVARESRRLFGGHLGEVYRDLAIQLDLYRIPPLAVSDQVPGPMAFGVQKPAIMLPERIVSRLSQEELKAVLAHELAHCQRGDLWLNWIQLILLSLWWFHPVLWLVNRSLRNVREDCCDDLLLARGVLSNDAYCEVLLRAAKELATSSALTTALAFGQGMHPLARRLARLTDWTLERSEKVSTAGALTVLVAAVCLFPGGQNKVVNAESEPAAMPVSLASLNREANAAHPQPADSPALPRPTVTSAPASALDVKSPALLRPSVPPSAPVMPVLPVPELPSSQAPAGPAPREFSSGPSYTGWVIAHRSAQPYFSMPVYGYYQMPAGWLRTVHNAPPRRPAFLAPHAGYPGPWSPANARKLVVHWFHT